MGNKSKARAGSFSGNRWRGYEMLVEVHSRHPKGQKSYEKQIVPLKIISHGKVFMRSASSIDVRGV